MSRYNLVLGLLAETGDWEETLAALNGMEASGVQPDSVSFIICMQAAGEAGMVKETLALLKRIKEPGETKAVIYTLAAWT
jgi:pentatricopeptide repeat protein